MRRRRTLEHVRPRPPGDPLAQRLITHQADDRGRRAAGTRRRKLQHVLAVASVVADAADIDGDDRQTSGHRLGHDDAEALRFREVEEDVGAHGLRDPVGAVAVQAYPIVEAAVDDHSPDRLALGAVAVDVEGHVHALRAKHVHRLDRHRQVLARHQPSGGGQTDRRPQSILGL